jgi:hypothetical protein
MSNPAYSALPILFRMCSVLENATYGKNPFTFVRAFPESGCDPHSAGQQPSIIQPPSAFGYFASRTNGNVSVDHRNEGFPYFSWWAWETLCRCFIGWKRLGRQYMFVAGWAEWVTVDTHHHHHCHLHRNEKADVVRGEACIRRAV